MNTSITISAADFRNLPKVAQDCIVALLSGDDCPPISQATEPAFDEKSIAILDMADAKHFLNNCSDKTISVLQFIIDNGGRVMLSDVSELTGNTADQLRGTWAGLTKRIRTVTGDPDARLLNWFRQGDDWVGIMAQKTTEAMRAALSAR